MTVAALLLIVFSATLHATWNYLAKISGSGQSFVWLYLMMSTFLYAPVFTIFYFLQNITFDWISILFVVGSGIAHLFYAVLLQKGYQIGDFSLIYPMARGTGPMIVAVLAIFIYQEQVNLIGATGIILILLGVFLITGGIQMFQQLPSVRPIVYGILIGIMIASYTLLDKGAVGHYGISPILINYGGIVIQFLFLTPEAFRQWDEVKKDWQHHRKKIIGIGILNPLAYILILTAMSFSPVSYVASMREISILFGAVMGSLFLREGFGKQRIMASLMMILGIIAITVS